MKRGAPRSAIGTIASAVLIFAIASAARAHGPFGTLTDRGYQQMREMAHDLDGQARHANDQAQHQGFWIYGHDTRFLRSVSNFARRASQFHARMDSYRTQPWQVDEELRGLLRDARVVQVRIQRSRSVDEHTVADWNQVVGLLNQMIRLYQDDTGGARYGDPSYHRPPEGSGASTHRDVPPAPYDQRRAGGQADLAALAHELADRSARVADVARQFSGSSRYDEGQRQAFQTIQHFAEQASAFHERVESGLNPDQLRDNAAHLAEDGAAADQQIRRGNVPPEIRADWNAAMQLLERIRSAAGI